MPTDKPTDLRAALVQDVTFLTTTFRVHVSHDWGNLFCRDCGKWPDEPGSKMPCKGPTWRTAKAPGDEPVYAVTASSLAAALRAHDKDYASDWRTGDKDWTWERIAPHILDRLPK